MSDRCAFVTNEPVGILLIANERCVGVGPSEMAGARNCLRYGHLPYQVVNNTATMAANGTAPGIPIRLLAQGRTDQMKTLNGWLGPNDSTEGGEVAGSIDIQPSPGTDAATFTYKGDQYRCAGRHSFARDVVSDSVSFTNNDQAIAATDPMYAVCAATLESFVHLTGPPTDGV